MSFKQCPITQFILKCQILFRNNDFYGICLNRVQFHAREIKLSNFSKLPIAHVFNRVSSSNVPNKTFLCIMFATYSFDLSCNILSPCNFEKNLLGYCIPV